MSEGEPRQISRRTVLKGAAVGAIAVATELYVPQPVRAWVSELANPEATEQATERVYRPGEFVRWGNRGINRIYLTMDPGGSESNIRQVMNVAENEGAKITFFPTGLTVNKHLSFWAEVISRGHEVGNHTWAHPNLRYLPRSEVRSQLLNQRDIVQRAAALAGIDNYQQIFMRPPYGAGRVDPEVISVCQELNYVIAMWSSDPKGYKSNKTPDMVVRRFLNNLSNGLILLQHSGGTDIEAFPRIVREAKQRGYVMDKTMRQGIPTTVYP